MEKISSQVEVVLPSEPDQAGRDPHEEDREAGEGVGGGNPDERVVQVSPLYIFNTRHVQEEVGRPSLCNRVFKVTVL